MGSSVSKRWLAPAALLIALSPTVSAQEDTAPDSVWHLKLAAGAIREPDFAGSRTASTVPTMAVDASYRTDGWGTFLLNTDDNGLAWVIIDYPDYAMGPALGYDDGRSDKHKRNFNQPGSRRLHGLGDIAATWEYGLFGSVVVADDIPITLIIRRAPADAGHGGTRLHLTADFAIDVTDQFTCTLSPGLTWADAAYMRSYFGIDATQSARSGKPQYRARSEVYNYLISLDADYRLNRHWFIKVDYTLSRLSGDADNSPVVEKATQQGIGLSIGYQF
jgi:outer membrane scaffolding protein for murein synthesis (MipA/OmpV family)